MNLILSQPISLEIARRSRGTARVAVGLVGWLSEFCSAYDRPPDANAAKEALALKDIGRRKGSPALIAPIFPS